MQVAEYLASHVCQSALEGLDSCVMAYGQTGAGKTFSLHGAPEMHGALPVLLQMFDGLAEQATLRMSVLNLRNEKLCDLLVDTPSECRLRATMEREVYVENSTKLDVADSQTALMVLENAWKRSCVRATHMGQLDSRSTSIVILETTIQDGTEEFSSRHFLVDWAGSERPRMTGGDRFFEAMRVNGPYRTLRTLHGVVANLADPEYRHIPYRDSKATRLLQSALGDAMDRTLLLGCLNPAEATESLSTLRFATRFHNIPFKTRPPRRSAAEFVPSLGGAMVKPAASAASRQVAEVEDAEDVS